MHKLATTIRKSDESSFSANKILCCCFVGQPQALLKTAYNNTLQNARISSFYSIIYFESRIP